MNRTSEYVSTGHPDAIADFIVSFILDRYLEKDPGVRFAMECQIKDNFVTLGGEVTSTAGFGEEDISGMVKDAVREIGYTEEYASWWGRDNTIDPSLLDVTSHISSQSPDIAKGVDSDGWGDQGIMWGMACGTESTDYLPEDHFIARKIGESLFSSARHRELPIGLDIKTQVTMNDDVISSVIVAAPMLEEFHKSEIAAFARSVAGAYGFRMSDDASVTVNGTGVYVRHASQGDCGTTGRKLAVDFYGGNCRIGGGCPWGKDATKADVTLNIYARVLAKEMLEKTGRDKVYCSIACCIGKPDITISYYDGAMNQIGFNVQSVPAPEIIAELGLRRPVFASKKAFGLFSDPSEKSL